MKWINSIIKISQKDAILIKRNLCPSNGYGALRLLSEFQDESWKLGSIDTRRVATIDRQSGSGKPRSVHLNENIANVEDLVLS